MASGALGWRTAAVAGALFPMSAAIVTGGGDGSAAPPLRQHPDVILGSASPISCLREAIKGGLFPSAVTDLCYRSSYSARDTPMPMDSVDCFALFDRTNCGLLRYGISYVGFQSVANILPGLVSPIPSLRQAIKGRLLQSAVTDLCHPSSYTARGMLIPMDSVDCFTLLEASNCGLLPCGISYVRSKHLSYSVPVHSACSSLPQAMNSGLLRSAISSVGGLSACFARDRLDRYMLMSCSPNLKIRARGVHTVSEGGDGAANVLVLNMDGIVVQNPAGSKGCAGLFCRGLGGIECGRPGISATSEDKILLELKQLRMANPKLDKIIQMLEEQFNPMNAGNLKLDKIIQMLEDLANQLHAGNTVNPTKNERSFWNLRAFYLFREGEKYFEHMQKFTTELSTHFARMHKYYLIAVPLVAWLSVGLTIDELYGLLLLRFARKLFGYMQEVFEYRQNKKDAAEAALKGLSVEALLSIRKMEADDKQAAMVVAREEAQKKAILESERKAHEASVKKRLDERDAEDKVLALLYGVTPSAD